MSPSSLSRGWLSAFRGCRIQPAIRVMSAPPGFDRPGQQRQGIGFVVIAGGIASGAHRVDHCEFVGIALAGGVALDRADRNPLGRDLVVFAPGGEVSEESAIGVSGIHPGVATDFLEVHRVDRIGGLFQFGQPVLEP